MASLLFSPPLRPFPSPFAPAFYENPQRVPALLQLKSLRKRNSPTKSQTLAICFALTESDSPKSVDGGGGDGGDILPLLRELAESFDLPSDYLEKLPRDLRLDLNDAAFDLSNGPVLDECGQELGEMLLNLSRAWEKADTSTSNSITCQFPSLQNSLKDNVKSAFSRRLISAGRRFQSMGQYGQGELQKIAKAMVKTGKALSTGPEIKTDEKPKEETRMLKFGELQDVLTREKANIGAAVAAVFGFVSWGLSQGVQSIPENAYANDNAKSLRGALLVLSYSSTILSASASVALLFLARQLGSGSGEGKQ